MLNFLLNTDVPTNLWNFATTYIFPILYGILAIAIIYGIIWQAILTVTNPDEKMAHIKNIIYIFVIGAIIIGLVILIQLVIIPPLIK